MQIIAYISIDVKYEIVGLKQKDEKYTSNNEKRNSQVID